MRVYKLCFYVPVDHVETVKNAVFEAGAGRIGHYERCSFQVRGQGQFRPLEGSQPFLGQRGKIETVAEFRVEMICAEAHLSAAVRALRRAHPYEEPAIDVWKLEQPPD
jgi:hypothetical protein